MSDAQPSNKRAPPPDDNNLSQSTKDEDEFTHSDKRQKQIQFSAVDTLNTWCRKRGFAPRFSFEYEGNLIWSVTLRCESALFYYLEKSEQRSKNKKFLKEEAAKQAIEAFTNNRLPQLPTFIAMGKIFHDLDNTIKNMGIVIADFNQGERTVSYNERNSEYLKLVRGKIDDVLRIMDTHDRTVSAEAKLSSSASKQSTDDDSKDNAMDGAQDEVSEADHEQTSTNILRLSYRPEKSADNKD